jgi:hypothetical protein
MNFRVIKAAIRGVTNRLAGNCHGVRTVRYGYIRRGCIGCYVIKGDLTCALHSHLKVGDILTTATAFDKAIS